MNWINTNISNIQTYFNKKDYLILGIVILISINIGIGAGYFINTNYLAKPEISKNANANIYSDQIAKNQILDVDLGITIEEQDILNQIQNEATVTATTVSSQSSTSTQSKANEDKFREILAPKDPSQTNKPETPKQNTNVTATTVSPQINQPNLTKTSAAEINDANGRKITYNLKQFGINAGYVWDTDIAELGQNHPYSFGINDNQAAYFPTQPTHIEQIIPAQANCPNYSSTIQGQKNWLSFAKYGVEAPIINGSFGDFYNYNSDGQVNLNSEIQEDKNAIANGNYESVPVQKLLKAGVVHLPISPAPGQVGNSYIIGHTSNFPQVRSDYNKIFKPFESKSRAGDEFTIWDHKCRQMTFRVFEAFAIDEYDTATAYQNMGNRRVVTLQGSILDANWQPTKRWLTRAELVE
jgi:Sortase domain/Capsule polysaccharide biosynthesis protein